MAEFGNTLPDEENSNLGSTSQDKQSPSPTGAPHNIRPNTLSTNQDAYWFAHAADPPTDRIPARHNPAVELDENGDIIKRLDDEQSPHDNENSRNAPRNRGVDSPCQSESKDESSPLSQKEREDRFRVFKERQEDERQRRLQDLQQQSIIAQRFREQQEDERRRKIDDLRQKDIERRTAVEERKRQIWEADQERKEAILRRNLEREAKIEARRNAHRNSMSFAFGSSTPRVIDLDLGGFVNKSPTNPFNPAMIHSTMNGRRTPSGLDRKPDEVDSTYIDFSPTRTNRRTMGGMSSEATKACLTYTYDRTVHFDLLRSPYNPSSNPSWLIGTGVVIGAEDSMSRSMVILPSASRGRRKTDLTPTLPWEREISMRSQSPASTSSGMANKRAVSMSRLDMLAQPRRRYVAVEHSPSTSNIASSQVGGGSTSGNGTTFPGPRTTSSSMSKSMFNLANGQTFKRGPAATGGLRGLQSRASGVSSSMLQIVTVSRSAAATTTTINGGGLAGPRTNPLISSSPQRLLPSASKRMLSRSMCHLAPSVVTTLPPARPTRASRLRATHTAAPQDRPTSTSSYVLDTNRASSSISEVRKDSPSRPRSSMSGTSEMSAASTVSMRSQSGPRRPRPVSMVGAIPDASQRMPTPPQRQSRTSERKIVPVGVTPPRPPRAKSAGPDALVVPPPKPPPRKTAIPPKEIKESSPKPIEKPIASIQPNTVEPPIAEQAVPTVDPVATNDVPVAKEDGVKPRISSEEEAKAALAEKRRLAREQAEREAELERLRVEEEKRQEEERKRLEEEEQRRFEEEQLRLAQELRIQEEEKLQKAIAEQQERELEERKRVEEEAKLRVEREEQEKKAKEEAEKQRQELEEKLKKEEIERAERKKRVEQIMKRTRAAKAGASQDGELPPDQNASAPLLPPPPTTTSVTRPTVPPPAIPVNGLFSKEDLPIVDVRVDEIVESDNKLYSNEANQPDQNNKTNEVEVIENKDSIEVNKKAAEVIHTNGFSSPDESITEGISPEDKTDPIVSNLLDFAMPTTEQLLRDSSSIEFDQLIDLNTATTTTNIASNQNEVNLGDVNSNRLNNPFIAFEDNVTKKQEATFTDLLS